MTNQRRKQIRRRRKLRNKKRNKNGFIKWFKKLNKWQKSGLIVGTVVLLMFLIIIGYVGWMLSKVNFDKTEEDEIVINDFEDDSVGEGYTNFVLFGGDSRSGDVTQDLNTDSIIVVSLNNETREVKMVSVYRDTLLDVSKNSIRKCNSAYASGGATQAINMLNKNLDLNIQKYVTVNWKAVTDVVDMLGGIEIDVSEKEWREMNKYIGETGEVAGKKVNMMTHAGLQTLDGVQATTYARIRKNVGDDYARTERQRLVIEKVVEKAKKMNFSTLNKIVEKVFPQIATNLTMTEILSYARHATKYNIGDTTGFPFDKGSGNVPGRGSSVYPITLKSNVVKLHEFLYGTEDYKPSSTVVKISGEIAAVVGNREVEPNSTWKDDGSNTTTKPTDDEKQPTTNTPENPDQKEETPGDGTGDGTGTDDGTGEGTGTGGGTGEGTGTGGGTGEGTGTGGGAAPGTGTGGEGSGTGGTTDGAGSQGVPTP